MSTTRPLEFAGTDRYYLDPELRTIVNIALAMEKPLLLTGEAGTGKTQLALEVARALSMDTEILRAKSTIKGEEACYTQDTVLRLNDARFGPGSSWSALLHVAMTSADTLRPWCVGLASDASSGWARNSPRTVSSSIPSRPGRSP